MIDPWFRLIPCRSNDFKSIACQIYIRIPIYGLRYSDCKIVQQPVVHGCYLLVTAAKYVFIVVSRMLVA